MIRYSNYWRFIIWLIARVKYFIFAILISLLNFQFDSSLKNQILYVIYPTNNIFLYKHQNGERDLKLLYIYIYIYNEVVSWKRLGNTVLKEKRISSIYEFNKYKCKNLLVSSFFIYKERKERKKKRKKNKYCDRKKKNIAT